MFVVVSTILQFAAVYAASVVAAFLVAVADTVLRFEVMLSVEFYCSFYLKSDKLNNIDLC